MAVHAVEQGGLLVAGRGRVCRQQRSRRPGGGGALGVAHQRLMLVRRVLPRPARAAEVAADIQGYGYWKISYEDETIHRF